MLACVKFAHVKGLWLKSCVEEEGNIRLSPSSTSVEAHPYQKGF